MTCDERFDVLPGPDTIQELRHSLLLADLERSGGIGVHASPLAEVSDVGNVLQKAGFALPATGPLISIFLITGML